MKKIIYFTITAASLFASPALAQSNQIDDVFGGVKIGIETGLLLNNIKVAAPGNVEFDYDHTGLALRGFAGYDAQMGENFVLGAEFGLGLGTEEEGSIGTASFKLDQGLIIDASVRAGFLLSKNWLLYGRAGYSTSNMEITVANTEAGAANPSRPIDVSNGGLLLGGGTELALSDSFNLRLEYRRADYGDFKTSQAMLGAVIKF